jgi:hypothetical protein
MKLIDLSSNIWYNDLLESDDTSIVKIQTWLISRIGDLNTRLSTKIQILDNECSPELTEAQATIFAVLYLYNYYTRQVKINANAGQFSVLEVSEGDSTVRMVNRNEIAKTFRGLAQDTLNDLNKMCQEYKVNSAIPVSINNPYFIPYWSFLYTKSVDQQPSDNSAPISYN